MTGGARAIQNRINALKSTGPKTKSGKSAVAGNAISHGATSRPDPQKVATWLRVILNRPGFGVDDFLSGDAHLGAALGLAEAEARLLACEEALRAFEQRAREPADLIPGVLAAAMGVISDMNAVQPKGSKIRRGEMIVTRMVLRDCDEILWGGTRHSLLLRYLAEARSRRRGAFKLWLLSLEREKQELPFSRNKAKEHA